MRISAVDCLAASISVSMAIASPGSSFSALAMASGKTARTANDGVVPRREVSDPDSAAPAPSPRPHAPARATSPARSQLGANANAGRPRSGRPAFQGPAQAQEEEDLQL